MMRLKLVSIMWYIERENDYIPEIKLCRVYESVARIKEYVL